MASSGGLSRRALFGLGVSRLRERLDEQGPLAGTAPSPRAPHLPTAADVAERWAAARTPQGDALWAPVAEELLAFSGVPEPAPFALQTTPTGRDAVKVLARAAAPGATIAFAVWTTGLLPQLLKAAAALDPLPAGVVGGWGWSSRERLRQDLDRVADDPQQRRGELCVDGDGLAPLVERLAAAVPPLAATLASHGSAARERFVAAAAPYAAEGPGGVVLPVPYLLVRAVAR